MIQRVKDILFRGKKIRLCMTMDTLLTIQEEYDCTLQNLFDVPDKEKYEREIYVLMLLSREGKSVTDYENDYDVLKSDDFKSLQPYEREELTDAMWSAIAKAFKKDYEEEETDLTLLEIKKKKTNIIQKAKSWIRRKRSESA